MFFENTKITNVANCGELNKFLEKIKPKIVNRSALVVTCWWQKVR